MALAVLRTCIQYPFNPLYFSIASFIVHVRRSDVVALQNVKDPQSWLRIRNNQLEGNVSPKHCGRCVWIYHLVRLLFRAKVDGFVNLEYKKMVR